MRRCNSRIRFNQVRALNTWVRPKRCKHWGQWTNEQQHPASPGNRKDTCSLCSQSQSTKSKPWRHRKKPKGSLTKEQNCTHTNTLSQVLKYVYIINSLPSAFVCCVRSSAFTVIRLRERVSIASVRSESTADVLKLVPYFKKTHEPLFLRPLSILLGLARMCNERVTFPYGLEKNCEAMFSSRHIFVEFVSLCVIRRQKFRIVNDQSW